MTPDSTPDAPTPEQRAAACIRFDRDRLAWDKDESEFAALLSEIQDRIANAIRDAVATEREAFAALCQQHASAIWKAYKTGWGPERASDIAQGRSIGAEECAEAIRRRT